jgi:glycosyltransferase involved in cell wall biosynthesis
MTALASQRRDPAPAALAGDRRPTFSVVIAVFNGAGTLQRALDSVFDQSYPGWEIVVMDGGSTDGTQAILERNADRIAYWESAPDRGICHAWNKALDHVTGDWICFLGADDRYHDADVFARIAEALPAPEADTRIVYGQLARIKGDGWVQHRGGKPWTRRHRRRFAKGEMIPHPSTFHRRSIFDERGRFDERFKIAGDYEWLLRELLARDPAFVRVVVVDMAPGGLSNRPSTALRMAREVYLARYLNGRVRTPPWRSSRLWRQLARIWLDRYVAPRVSGVRARLGRGAVAR